jgi:hypothetical protein
MGEEIPPPGVTAAAPPGRNPRGLAGSMTGEGRGRPQPPRSESPPAKSSPEEGVARVMLAVAARVEER